jgi:hypothetical protein
MRLGMATMADGGEKKAQVRIDECLLHGYTASWAERLLVDKCPPGKIEIDANT